MSEIDWSRNNSAPLRSLLDPTYFNDGADPWGQSTGPQMNSDGSLIGGGSFNSDGSIRDLGGYNVNHNLSPYINVQQARSTSDGGFQGPTASVNWNAAPKPIYQGTGPDGRPAGSTAANSTKQLYDSSQVHFDPNYGYVTPSWNQKPERAGIDQYMPMAIMMAASMGMGAIAAPAIAASLGGGAMGTAGAGAALGLPGMLYKGNGSLGWSDVAGMGMGALGVPSWASGLARQGISMATARHPNQPNHPNQPPPGNNLVSNPYRKPPPMDAGANVAMGRGISQYQPQMSNTVNNLSPYRRPQGTYHG